MDTVLASKEMAANGDKNIVAQSATEELLEAIDAVKAPRTIKEYELRLFRLAQQHFNITSEEFSALGAAKKKILEEVMLEKARKDWRGKRIKAKIFFGAGTIGITVSFFLACFVNSVFIFGISSAFFLVAGVNQLDSLDKRFLDVYDEFQKLKQKKKVA